MKLKVLDLFSGIGGFSLGFEKAGMETVAFCENNIPCREVLQKNWPKIIIAQDIKTIYSDGKFLMEDHIQSEQTYVIAQDINVIAGGFPCKGHSVAGKKDGFKNKYSALWKEYFRLAKEIKPKYCILENSPNLRNTGLAEILKSFDKIGYNAEWSIISAYSIGAPHQRERFYCVFWRKELSYCDPFRSFHPNPQEEKAQSNWWTKRRFKRSPLFKQASKIEPKVLQFNDGLQEKLDINKVEEEIKMIGNSLLPQIPELIGRAIVEHENNQQPMIARS